jgi:hypothetical protein
MSIAMDSSLDGSDRREHERFESSAMVQYFFKKISLRFMDCELVDVSRSGVAIRVPVSEDVFFGMDAFLEITLPGSLDHITVKGTIAWSQSTETGLVGIRFESLIDQEILTRLLVC